MKLPVKKHQYSGGSTSALLLSGSRSIKFLPEAKEARGSDPGVGGTLTGVLSVHGESHRFSESEYFIVPKEIVCFVTK